MCVSSVYTYAAASPENTAISGSGISLSLSDGNSRGALLFPSFRQEKANVWATRHVTRGVGEGGLELLRGFGLRMPPSSFPAAFLTENRTFLLSLFLFLPFREVKAEQHADSGDAD